MSNRSLSSFVLNTFQCFTYQVERVPSSLAWLSVLEVKRRLQIVVPPSRVFWKKEPRRWLMLMIFWPIPHLSLPQSWWLLYSCNSIGSVKVCLRNQGPDAYRPGIYGKSIKIERKIVKDGTGSYKIMSERGNVISTKKEDMNTILDHMNICIDNPLSVLTQDTSRLFLANSSAKEKYNVRILSFFFLNKYRFKIIICIHTCIHPSSF